MTMLLGRTVGACLAVLLLGAGSAVAVREVNERASQPLPVGTATFTLDPVEQADQALAPDCANLKRLAQQAEVSVLAVQFAQRAQSSDYPAQIVALQTAIAQLQSVKFPAANVESLRQAYVQHLQSVPSLSLAKAPIAKLDQQVQQVTQFNREQIIFSHCQS